jgi:hypothetical protein
MPAHIRSTMLCVRNEFITLYILAMSHINTLVNVSHHHTHYLCRSVKDFLGRSVEVEVLVEVFGSGTVYIKFPVIQLEYLIDAIS